LPCWLILGAEAQRDNALEVGYLVRLQRDFEHNLSQADSAVAVYTQAIVAIGQIQEIMRGGTETPPSDSLPKLFRDAFATTYPQPQKATYVELVGSGRLDILRSDSLRSLLSTWEGEVEWHDVMKQKELMQWMEIVEPYAAEHLSPSDWAMEELNADQDFSLGSPRSPFAADYAAVLRDPLLWNILSLKSCHAFDLQRATGLL
jgi:hypothetical protein